MIKMMNKIEQLKLSEDGFTLIEMMIVVAIIAILTAIALPKFNESLAMANTSRVQADLQSLDTAIAMYMPSSLQDHLRDPPAWTKAFLRTFGCGIANHFQKETKKHEHTCNRADRGCCSVRRVRFLRTLAGEQMGYRPESQDACR